MTSPVAIPAPKKQKKGKDKAAVKGRKETKAKQTLPVVEALLGMQLGDSAERGKSGMVLVFMLHILKVWLRLQNTVIKFCHTSADSAYLVVFAAVMLPP